MPTAFRRSPLALAVLGVLDAGPMHPYGIQRRLRDWGKNDVVNVANRAGLYKTIERLAEGGLIEEAGTGRDQGYPERTLYRITDDGRAAAREWLADAIAVPRNEFPELPTALSFAPMLEPDELLTLLRTRARELSAALAGQSAILAGAGRFPRVLTLDAEVIAAHTRAELDWVNEIVAAIERRELSWERDQLVALAESAGGESR